MKNKYCMRYLWFLLLEIFLIHVPLALAREAAVRPNLSGNDKFAPFDTSNFAISFLPKNEKIPFERLFIAIHVCVKYLR